jgi:hypothetical protein
MSGIRRISTRGTKPSTQTPDDERYEFTLKTHSALFRFFVGLLLEFKPLPSSVLMPDGQNLWFFIGTKGYALSKLAREQRSLTSLIATRDYDNGCLRNEEEIKKLGLLKIDLAPNSIKNALREAKNVFNVVNSNKWDDTRLNYANFGIKSFFMLFIAATAMNPSTAMKLRWNEEYDVSPNAQGMRIVTVKNRAGKKIVSFEIKSKFLSVFRQYLKLRSYILRGHSFEYLFCKASKCSGIKHLDQYGITNYKVSLNTFYPEASWVTSRELRKAKADWLIRVSDISVATHFLQNTEETVRNHYADGSLVNAAHEMSDFYSNITNAAVDNIRTPNTEVPVVIISSEQGVGVAVGSCTDYGEAVKMIGFNDKVMEPNCEKPEGCLFCKHFALHADDTDIRKLFSCMECLLALRQVADNEIHFLEKFGPILDRIEQIISQLSTEQPHKKHLINKIKIEVQEEGLLDDFWSGHYDMLIDLGVVS